MICKDFPAVFDHEAAANMPEMVTRKMLLGGKYATVSTRKLAPGEKRMDPIKALLQIRDEIVREQAEAATRQEEASTGKPTRTKAA